MIFDTHAHYDDEAFQEDRDELLNSLNTHGIEAVVNVGASIQTTKNTLELMKKYPFVYGAVGVHPSETEELNDYLMDWLKHVSGEKKVVAIGEIGLDYYWKEPDPEIQKHWFVRQLQLAREVKLPVIIHSRDAARDTLDIMKAEKAGEIGGVIHCFSYTKETAREFQKWDYYFGIGGVLTFKNAKKLKEAAAELPIERILLETDCPYLAPEPYRGKRNSSLYLPRVVAALAELKGLTCQEIEDITWHNGCRFYGLE